MKKNLFFIFLSLYSILNSQFSFSQWTNNSAVNTPVCLRAGDDRDARIISDGQGGAIMTWVQDSLGDANIYAQRLDSAGFAQWANDGIPVCKAVGNQLAPFLAEDGNGGAIIVWKDERNGNSDIYVQRINNTGTALWTNDGIAVDTKTGAQIDPKIVSNDLGESIIVWQDSVSGNWDIYAQKLNFSGTKMWSAGGVVVCNAGNDQINPRIEEGGTIVWQDKRNGNDYDIYAQALNSSGVPQWAANGVAVCSLAETQNNPKIKSDGSGGAIIAWVDKRNTNDYNIYAQRLNSLGAAQWGTNGKLICGEANNQSAIDISTDKIDGAIITWKDFRNNIYADIYAQFINLSGTIQWTINGIPVTTKTYDQINPNIATDSSGAIIVWQDSSSGQWDVYAQKILLNGTSQWGTNGKFLGNAAGSQLSPKHISDGKGGAIVAFEDKRGGTSFDIYAQNINSDGTLGTISGINTENSLNKILIFPNPNMGIFNIQCSIFNVQYSMIIYNNLGEKIYQSNIQYPISNIQLHQPCGIYFYRISSEEKIMKSGKIIVK